MYTYFVYSGHFWQAQRWLGRRCPEGRGSGDVRGLLWSVAELGRLVRWQADHGKVDTSYEFVMSHIRDMRGDNGTAMRFYEGKNLHNFNGTNLLCS